MTSRARQKGINDANIFILLNTIEACRHALLIRAKAPSAVLIDDLGSTRVAALVFQCKEQPGTDEADAELELALAEYDLEWRQTVTDHLTQQES